MRIQGNNDSMLIPVILAGGAGSRLWPVSREALPKPFIRLRDGRSLLRRTLDRTGLLDGVSTVVTVANREYYFPIRDEYAGAAGKLKHVFLLEPCARNTAPAIAMAALWASANRMPGARLLVLPADHLIEDEASFAAAVVSAGELAAAGHLVTLGIAPTRPETGFGYIECGPRIGGGEGCRVLRFMEKPALESAREFAASGRFLWNSGMFCFRADRFLEALRACDSALHETIGACWAATPPGHGDRIEIDPDSFARLPDISVDYAVMEKHDDVTVVKARFDWNDIGSWNALSELAAADGDGNRTVGESILLGARDCYIQSDSRVVAAVGVEKLVVVDTPDALLVAHKDRVQDVKQVVERLRLADHAAYRIHRTVRRPWGTYTVVEEGAGYKIKRIVVRPGASLSLQLHRHRSEHWVVLSGTARVIDETDDYVVRPNQSTFIAQGHKHRLENPGNDDLVIIEVQAGQYVGEDDIVRFDDVYGRK